MKFLKTTPFMEQLKSAPKCISETETLIRWKGIHETISKAHKHEVSDPKADFPKPICSTYCREGKK